MNDNPFSTEWNNDAAEYEHERARTTCLNCNGTGSVPDIFGDYEPCEECADYTDAIAEAIVPEPGMPF